MPIERNGSRFHFQPGRWGAQRSMVKLAGGIADRGYGIDLVLGHADGHYSSEVHPAVRIVDLGARKMVLSILPSPGISVTSGLGQAVVA